MYRYATARMKMCPATTVDVAAANSTLSSYISQYSPAAKSAAAHVSSPGGGGGGNSTNFTAMLAGSKYADILVGLYKQVEMQSTLRLKARGFNP